MQTNKLETEIQKATTALGFEHNLEKIQQSLSSITDEITIATKVKNDTEANQSKYQAEFNNLKAKLTEANTKKASLEERKTNIENERKVAQENYDEAERLANEAIKKYDDHHNTITEVQSAINDLKAALNKAEASETEATNIEYNELKQKATELKTKINEKLVEANQKLAALKSAEEKENQRISALKQELKTATKNLEDTLKDYQKQTLIDKKQESLDKVKAQLDLANTLDKKITDNNDQTKTDPEYTEFKQKLDSVTSTYETEKTNLAKAKQEIENKVKNLETETNDALKKANDAITSNKEVDLQSALDKLKEIKNKATALKNEISPKGYQIETNKVIKFEEDLSSKITEVDNKLNAEKNRIKAVAKALDQAQTSLDQAIKNVTDNKDNVTKLTEALTTLQATITTTEGIVNQYDKPENNSVSSLKEKLNKLKETLKTAKQTKKDLEKQNKEKTEKIDKQVDDAKKKADEAIKKADDALKQDPPKKDDLDKAKKDLEDAKKDLNDAKKEADKNHYDGKSKEAEEKSKEVDKKLKEITDKLADEQEKETKRIAKVKKALEDTINSLKQINNDVKTLTGVDELNENLPKLQTEITKARDQVYNIHNVEINKKIPELKTLLEFLDKLIKDSEQTNSTKSQELTTKTNATNNKVREAKEAVTKAIEEAKKAPDNDVDKLSEAVETLNEAKTKAEEAKNLATTNKYQEKVTEAQGLITEVEKQLKETQAKLNAAKQDQAAKIKKLVEDIQAEITKVETAETEANNAKDNIDESDIKLPLLNQAITNANAKHSEFQGNPLASKEEVKTKLAALKQASDKAKGTWTSLTATQNTNKQLVEKAVNDIKNLVTLVESKANNAISSKKISDLEDVLKDLVKAIDETKKAKTLTEQKHYSSKTNEANGLLTKLNELKQDTQNALDEAKRTEEERINKIKQEVTEMITKLDNAINEVKKEHATSSSLGDDIDKLEKLIEEAKKLQPKTESSSKLATEKEQLTKKLAEANIALEEANKEKARLAALEAAKQAAKNKINNEFTDLTNEQKTNAINEVDVAKTKEEVEQVVQKYQEINTKNRKEKIEQLKAKINKLTNDLNEASNKINSANDTPSLESAINNLETKLQIANNFINEKNNEKYPEINSEHNALKKLISDLKTKLQAAKDKLSTGKQKLEDDLNAAKNKLADAIKKANEAGDDKTKLNEAKTLLEEAKTDLEKVKTEAENKNYQKVITEATKEITKANNKISEIENKLAKIAEQERIKKIYEDAKAQIEALQYINYTDKYNFLRDLENNKTNETKINEILVNAKQRDRQYKNAKEENQKLSKEIEEFKKNIENNNDYYQIRNDLENILYSNKISLSDSWTDIEQILEKNKNLNKGLVDAKKALNKIKDDLIEEAKKNAEETIWEVLDSYKTYLPSQYPYLKEIGGYYTRSYKWWEEKNYDVSVLTNVNDQTGKIFARFTYTSKKDSSIKVYKDFIFDGFKKYESPYLTNYELNSIDFKSTKEFWDVLSNSEDLLKALNNYGFTRFNEDLLDEKLFFDGGSYNKDGDIELKYKVKRSVPTANSYGDNNFTDVYTEKTFKFNIAKKIKDALRWYLSSMFDRRKYFINEKKLPSDVTKDDLHYEDDNPDLAKYYKYEILDLMPNDGYPNLTLKVKISSIDFPEINETRNIDIYEKRDNLLSYRDFKMNIKFKRKFLESSFLDNFDAEFEKISKDFEYPYTENLIEKLKNMFDLEFPLEKYKNFEWKFKENLVRLVSKVIVGKDDYGNYKYEDVEIFKFQNIEYFINEAFKTSIKMYKKTNELVDIFSDSIFDSLFTNDFDKELTKRYLYIKEVALKWKNKIKDLLIEKGFNISNGNLIDYYNSIGSFIHIDDLSFVQGYNNYKNKIEDFFNKDVYNYIDSNKLKEKLKIYEEIMNKYYSKLLGYWDI
ncbi:hypothetical protein [Metamycoplasma buccale]|uniref:hypothetical protein n=1 Tax=Metamycoplasma buccale TaxID=55602 RepID=UPI00398F3FAF